MQEGGSRTARMVAAWRARAGVDEFADALAGPSGHADARAYDVAQPHMEIYLATRTRWFDDAVRAAIAAGTSQVVLLGAGYDTRAMRLAHDGVTYYEVDHPRTGAHKRAALAALEGYAIDAARYVGCDFERQDFVEELAKAGFDAAQPAIVVWEGVTYYLTEAAVRATLARVATLGPATRLCFDIVSKRFVAGRVNDAADLEARARVAQMGEPLRFGVDDVLPLLYEAGFRHVRTTSFDEACLDYTGTYDRARKLRFQTLVEARVGRFFHGDGAPA
ncbi:MAG: class I SAM-dependent methyltransferase [Sandaracinaceae bacterium]|nr:class I SAM-dependent methyltransferase [Sandaracinaceae bacterium]